MGSGSWDSSAQYREVFIEFVMKTARSFLTRDKEIKIYCKRL